MADDWRYWIPLVCMFTGARIGEVAQLRLDDICSEGDDWFLRIRHDPERGQAVKSATSRIAPIHSLLRRSGFLEFVERQRHSAGLGFADTLFPSLIRNGRGQLPLPSRFWRTYLQRIGIKDGRDGIGSHSFRHGLADQLRKAGCLDNEVAVAIGHQIQTVTSGYGIIKQGSPARLSRMIKGATFDGVDFTKLIENGRARSQKP